MTQPDKTKAIPDKLLTDEVNKQMNISTNSSVSNIESVPIIQESETMVHTDIRCNLVCDVQLSLLDLQQTNSIVSSTSYKNNINVPNNSTNNTNLPDFSVVNAHQDSDSSSESLYDTVE